MALFTEEELRISGKKYLDNFNKSLYNVILEEKQLPLSTVYDIFLSHSYLDKEKILGLKIELEKMRLSVYVDWIDDDDLDRRKVTKETADRIRTRMKNCKCLFYAISVNSQTSKWMPWECGYFDGLKHKVAILPVSKVGSSSFNGQEYLGLYPYIDKNINNKGSFDLRVNDKTSIYYSFTSWLNSNN